MRQLIVFSVLILCMTNTSTFAADTYCSNSQGSFQFVYEGYLGGISPAPGTIIGYRRLSLNDQILEENIIRQGGEKPIFEVTAAFDPESYFLVKNDASISPRVGQRIIYAQDVYVYREDGKELLSDLADMRTTVICTRSLFLLP